MARQGKTPVRGIRFSDRLWSAMQATAEKREENLAEVLRAFGREYAKDELARTEEPCA